MRVLLLHPPTPGIGNLRSESLGLGYIAAVLRRDGHEVEIIDANLRRLETRAVISEILSREFDCFGMTAMYQHRNVSTAILRSLRKAKPHVLIIMGGYLSTLATEPLLKACPEIDFVVRGEGETAVCEVINRIHRGEDWHDAPGVAFLDGDKVVMNQPPPLIKDLDSLPFPARDSLKAVHPSLSVKAMMSGSRGCYNKCSFCSINSFYAVSGGRGRRFRSPGNFVDEIESVIEETGYREFAFIDDDFIGPGNKCREHVTQIAQEILKRGIRIKFATQARADEIDEDTLKLLKECGLSCLILGIESGVQRQLDLYNKRISVEQNKEAIEICRRAGVEMVPGFIMFDPYSTIDEVQQNMRFAKEMGILVPVFKLGMYHGMPLLEKIREDGLLIEKGMDLDCRFKEPVTGIVWKAVSSVRAGTDFMRKIKLRLKGSATSNGAGTPTHH